MTTIFSGLFRNSEANITYFSSITDTFRALFDYAMSNYETGLNLIDY